MIALVRSELLKLRTTQVWFWLLVATVVLGALVVIGPLATQSQFDAGDVHNLFVSGASAYLAVFVLGILSMTTEYRYQTITPTFLTTPKRWQVVVAKGLSCLVVGVLYALVTVAVQAAVALPWLATKGADVQATGSNGIVVAILEAFVVVVLYGLVGFGVGALLRNQVVAVVVGLIYVIVLENLISAIPYVKDAYPYLPGGGAASITSRAGQRVINGIHLFPLAGGVVILLAWALVLAGVGTFTSLRRDIT